MTSQKEILKRIKKLRKKEWMISNELKDKLKLNDPLHAFVKKLKMLAKFGFIDAKFDCHKETKRYRWFFRLK